MPRSRQVRSVDDVLLLMDRLFESTADRWSDGAGAAWWDGFYADRTRPVPFFVDAPDENLVAWLDASHVPVGRALDLGCGNGRNARHLASRGFEVDAVDLSETAIAWAREQEGAHAGSVRYHVGDAFGPDASARAALAGPYDLVYDSGCLHHLPPHRRVGYVRLLDRVLAPGGSFGVVCFADGLMGTSVPDDELYLRGGLEGGLAFTPESLRWIFQQLEHVQTRAMVEQPDDAALFGRSFLLTALFRRPAQPGGAE